jgi:hypothetical protein
MEDGCVNVQVIKEFEGKRERAESCGQSADRHELTFVWQYITWQWRDEVAAAQPNGF